MVDWLRALLEAQKDGADLNLRRRRRSTEEGRRNLIEAGADALFKLGLLSEHDFEQRGYGLVCARCQRRAFEGPADPLTGPIGVAWPCPTVRPLFLSYQLRPGWPGGWLLPAAADAAAS
jgi:hypothetical protein